MFSAVQRTSSIISTILNHKCSYTKVIFLRLCKEPSNKSLNNRVWDKRTLHAVQRYPERYKHFITCRKYSTETHQDVLNDISTIVQYEREHIVMHSMLKNSIHYENSIMPPIKTKAEVSYEDICQLYTVDWSCASTSSIYDAIKKISYCYLSGSRFEPSLCDSIFQACTKKIPELNDKQLMILMQHLIVFAHETRKLVSWQPIIKTLSKECLKRFFRTNTEEMLLILDAFYQLEAPDADYMWRTLRKLTSKASKLSAKNLVQTLFYLSYCKSSAKANMFEIECRFQECISELSANEIGILAKGFFMNRARIKNKNLMEAIIKKVKQNIKFIHNTCLASVMKLIRYSDCCYCTQEFQDLLVSLQPEIPRLSLKCLTHLAHAFGGIRIYDEMLTKIVLERAKNEIKFARLKDIERILFAIYSVAPQTNYYQDICQELLNEVLLTYQTTRSAEIDRYPLSLVRILTYATATNVYLPKLIQHVLDPTFIQKIHKNNMRFLTNDLFILNCSVKIEFPHYKGPFLTETIYNHLIKKYLYRNDVHTKDTRVKLRSEIIFICKDNLGLNVCVDYILPHYSMKDMVIGFDEHNKSIEVESILSSMPDGSIKSVQSEELKKIRWDILYVIPTSQKVLGHNGYGGDVCRKMKQLKMIGYTPIPVYESEWYSLTNLTAKENYLKKLIYETRDQNLLKA